MIAVAVHHTLGSAGLVALAGVCSKWRQLVLSANMPLAESRRLFSAMKTSNVLASPNFFQSRFIDNAMHLVLNSEIHHEFFTEGVAARVDPAKGVCHWTDPGLWQRGRHTHAHTHRRSRRRGGQHVGGLWGRATSSLCVGDNYRLESRRPLIAPLYL